MDNQNYTIVAIAPDEIQNSFCNLNKSFNIPFEGCKVSSKFVLKDIAHFAVKRSFSLKQGTIERDIVDRIKKLNLKKSKIICKKSDLFLDTGFGDILYAKIDFNSELIEIHDEIKKQIDSVINTKRIEMEGEGYKPHISVVYDIPKEKEKELKKELDAQILPFEFYLDKLLLLKNINSAKDEREVIHTWDFI